MEHEDQIGRMLIGKLLKAERTSQGLSQREIAIAMGYNNPNFISMIENGVSRPPADRTKDIGPAYKMPKILTAVLLRQCDREVWDMIMDVIESLPEKVDVRNRKAVESALDRWFKKELKTHNIERI